jgi:hypothetical protein
MMKTTINKDNTEYPVLKYGNWKENKDQVIVLFVNQTSGIVLVNGYGVGNKDIRHVGSFISNFQPKNYSVWDKTIKLSNY